MVWTAGFTAEMRADDIDIAILNCLIGGFGLYLCTSVHAARERNAHKVPELGFNQLPGEQLSVGPSHLILLVWGGRGAANTQSADCTDNHPGRLKHVCAVAPVRFSASGGGLGGGGGIVIVLQGMMPARSCTLGAGLRGQ